MSFPQPKQPSKQDSLDILTPASLYKKSPGLQQTINNNLQFFSFKSRLRKVYKAIEFERSRQQSNTFSTDLESLEIFEIFCSGLLNSQSLQVLNLSSTNLPDLDMIRLSQALSRNKSLMSLDLSNNSLSSLGFKYLFRMLKENTHLQELNLFNNEIQKESINDMSSLISRNKSLVSINLNFCGIDSLGCRGLLEALTSNSHFKNISLNKNSFDDESFQAISYFLSKSFLKLEKFEFCYNSLDEHSLKVIRRKMMRFPLEKFMPTIHELNLMGNKFLSPVAIKHLKYILDRINGIQTLNLTKTFINYKNILDLASCFRRVHHSLILSNNVFKDRLPNNLSCLAHLKILTLSKTNLTGMSVINIAQTIKNEKKLQWKSLDLSHNQIFNEDCKALFDALRTNNTIQILNLSDNLIDEGALEDFGKYSSDLSLKELILSENPFTKHEFLDDLCGSMQCSLVALTLDNITFKKKSLLSSGVGQNAAFEFHAIGGWLNKLERLSLRNSLPLGPVFVKSILSLSDLQELNLENSCFLNKEILEDIGLFLGMTTKLQVLGLRNLYIGRLAPSDLKILCQAFPLNHSITRLDLSKNKLNTVLAQLLKSVGQMKSLKTLDLSHNYIDNKNCEAISSFLVDCPDLEEYILSDNLISFVTIDQLCFTIAENKEKIQLKVLKIANISFSLDCLISIGRMLAISKTLRELDLSNNEMVKINTATLSNKPINTIEKLQLTNCKYDEHQYKYLIRLLGRHPIKTLDLSGSIFFEANLRQFIRRVANLRSLVSLDLSYIALKDSEISDLLNRMKCHENLKTLRLNFLDIKEHSSQMICQLLKYNKSIHLLDISDNRLSGFFFEQLSIGLQENKSLKELNLRKTRMNDDSLGILTQAFKVNRVLQQMDLRFNGFSIKGLEKLMQMLNEVKNASMETLLVSENQLECHTIKEEFTLMDFSEELKKNFNLKVLDLENTFKFRPSEISSLSESLKNTTKLRSLNLSNNNLGSSEAMFLSKLILTCTSLEYLCVSRNKLGIQGLRILLENLDKNFTLKELDLSLTLSTEKEGDELCEFLNGILIRYKTLEIINISGNHVGEKGNKVLVGTLKHNSTVFFINTEWNKIRNDLACEILDSLIRLYKKIPRIEDVKEELKHLNFSKGKLDDDFCIHFSHRIQHFTYLESLNISENNKITLIGLKFIYVYLKFNVRLKRIYFKEYSRDSALNNGISASLIHWSKYHHFDSRLVKVIQKAVYYIFLKMQIVPNRFQYNESFDRFFAPISDTLIFWFFLINFLLQIFLAIFLPIYFVYPKCGGGQYWVSHIIYAIYLGITLLLELLFWILTKKKIHSLVMEKDLQREYFINDVLNLLGGVLLRFDFYTDVCFLTIAAECDTDKIFTASLIVVIIKTIVKTIENVRALYKLRNSIKKKQKMDCLNLYAKLCCFQSFVITNDILDRYCPGNAKKIKHFFCKKLHHSIYLNIFILDSLLKFALEDIPQTLLQCLFLFYKNGGEASKSTYNWIIWFSILKNGCSLIGSFYSMVSLRPSYIEQSDFDESLTVQKLFEGHNDKQFGLSFIKRYGTFDQRMRSSGLLKFGTGISNLSSSAFLRSGGKLRDSGPKNIKDERDSEDVVLEMSEDVSFERPEKMRYFQTEEKAVFLLEMGGPKLDDIH